MPNSEKGRNPRHALEYFPRSRTVWAETKYDGERAQIHVEVQDDGASKIMIFSKSRRDSTLDRVAVHDIIYKTLGLSRYGDDRMDQAKVRRGVILDAEMVACHGDKIDGELIYLRFVEHSPSESHFFSQNFGGYVV